MKLKDIRFHDAVNVDGKMLEKAEAGVACAFGVVLGADETLVPWTNVRWAKRADVDGVRYFEKPTEVPPELLGLGPLPEVRANGGVVEVTHVDRERGVITVGAPKKRGKREEPKT